MFSSHTLTHAHAFPLQALRKAFADPLDHACPAELLLPQVLRKAFASAVTLGSGASLGPEAPSVELGANTVRGGDGRRGGHYSEWV